MRGTVSQIDETHSLLARECRRVVLEQLATNSGSATVSELVHHLPQRTEAVSNEREARIELHHVHLPRLAEAGVVVYHDDGDRVTLTSRGERLERIRRQTEALVMDDRADVD